MWLRRDGVSPTYGIDPADPIATRRDEYFARLRCPLGHPYYFHRLGSLRAQRGSGSVDCAELRCFDGEDRRFLYFSMYESRDADAVPAGLGVGEPMGRGDCHTRYTDFPRSFRSTSSDSLAVEASARAQRVLGGIPSQADDPWYDSTPLVYYNPACGGLIFASTLPSASERSRHPNPAFHHLVANVSLAQLPSYWPAEAVPPAHADEHPDLKVYSLRYVAARLGRTSFSPLMGTCLPDRNGPQWVVGVRHPKGRWTPQDVWTQPWQQRLVGWDLSFGEVELLFPDYLGEGEVFAAATIEALGRAGVPTDLLSLKRGWFDSLPYSLYGNWLRQLDSAFGGQAATESVAIPANPLMKATLAAYRAAGNSLPADWPATWDALIGFPAGPTRSAS